MGAVGIASPKSGVSVFAKSPFGDKSEVVAGRGVSVDVPGNVGSVDEGLVMVGSLPLVARLSALMIGGNGGKGGRSAGSSDGKAEFEFLFEPGRVARVESVFPDGLVASTVVPPASDSFSAGAGALKPVDGLL